MLIRLCDEHGREVRVIVRVDTCGSEVKLTFHSGFDFERDCRWELNCVSCFDRADKDITRPFWRRMNPYPLMGFKRTFYDDSICVHLNSESS